TSNRLLVATPAANITAEVLPLVATAPPVRYGTLPTTCGVLHVCAAAGPAATAHAARIGAMVLAYLPMSIISFSFLLPPADRPSELSMPPRTATGGANPSSIPRLVGKGQCTDR